MNNDSNWNWGPGDSQLSPVPDREVKKWSGVKSLSCVQLFATPWTVAYHASPSMRFSRQQYQSGLPSPSPGDLPDPRIAPRSPTLQADALPSESPGKTRYTQSPGSPENPLDLESVWEGWGDENQGLSWIQSNPKQYSVSLVPNTQSLPPQPMAESGETLGSRLPRTVAGTQDAVSDSRSPTNKQVNGCRWWCLTHSLMWHLSPGPLTASPPIKMKEISSERHLCVLLCRTQGKQVSCHFRMLSSEDGGCAILLYHPWLTASSHVLSFKWWLQGHRKRGMWCCWGWIKLCFLYKWNRTGRLGTGAGMHGGSWL